MGEPAEQACQSFSRGDYAACLRHLSALPPADPRVEHNKALAEFMASDARGVERYRGVVARLAGASYPRGEVSAAALRRPTLVYNYAVVLYHARHYRQAEAVLGRLVEEALEPALRRRAVLLLVETCVCRREPRRALSLLAAHSRVFGTDASSLELKMVSRLACRAQLLLGESVEPSAEAREGVEGLLLAAHARHAAGDPRGAASVLACHTAVSGAYSKRTHAEDMWAALNNNLGIVYLSLGKPTLAAKYFQTAVKEQHRYSSEDAAKEGGARLTSASDRPLFVYNLGLALLAAGRYAQAFDCLLEAARHFPCNPRLWRRLAECCVRHEAPDPTVPPALIKYGSGAYTRVAVQKARQHEYSTAGESLAIPALSLEFGALCLRNALTLLPARPDHERSPAPPGPPLAGTARRALHQHVLLLHSYVLLQLQDPLGALQSATASRTMCAGAEGGVGDTLGALYASEALARLDRPGEAAELLARVARTGLAGVQVWATLAQCHVLRGEAGAARQILSQLDSPRLCRLQLYLECAVGDADACVAILRRMRQPT